MRLMLLVLVGLGLYFGVSSVSHTPRDQSPKTWDGGTPPPAYPTVWDGGAPPPTYPD